MLSPHEFSTLMLIGDDCRSMDLNRDEIRELLDRRLVCVGPDKLTVRITAHGAHLLKVLSCAERNASVRFRSVTVKPSFSL
jgi:hypothetical protein